MKPRVGQAHSPVCGRPLAGPFERELVDRAVGLLEELGPSQGPAVLVNQDLHGDNVLAAEREPWLTIDPKPLVGEMAFAPTPVIRSKELGHSREQVRRRLDRCSDELGLDRERVRGWAFAHTMAWAFDDGRAIPTHVETARWLSRVIDIVVLDHRGPAVAERIVEVQQAGYRIEAQITGYDGMPGLTQDADDVAALDGVMLGATVDETLVGVLGYLRHGDLVDVDRLAVHPDHFRRGIGASLLRGCTTGRPTPGASRS